MEIEIHVHVHVCMYMHVHVIVSPIMCISTYYCVHLYSAVSSVNWAAADAVFRVELGGNGGTSHAEPHTTEEELLYNGTDHVDFGGKDEQKKAHKKPPVLTVSMISSTI